MQQVLSLGKVNQLKILILVIMFYYAGDITRPGTNSQYHLVDERIVGLKPKTLTFKEAGHSLTAITAMKHCLNILLLIKVTGRKFFSLSSRWVGSIAIQLLKNLTNTKIIATASRNESMAWVKSLGADVVIDHNNNFLDELHKFDIQSVDNIFCINGIEQHFDKMVDAIKPFGKFVPLTIQKKIRHDETKMEKYKF